MIEKAQGDLVIFVLFFQELNASFISASDIRAVVSTNLNSEAGESEDSLCNRIKLERVNIFPVLNGRTNLSEYDPIFDGLVYNPLCGSVYRWRILYQQIFEVMEGRAERFRLCEHHQLVGMGSCKDTDGSVCGE